MKNRGETILNSIVELIIILAGSSIAEASDYD